jgi:hypothetical protein
LLHVVQGIIIIIIIHQQVIMKVFATITTELQDLIRRQKMFFVATAPSSTNGTHVNLSPKGYDCFRLVDESTVLYLDMTGSGNETAAHIQENGRLTIMFCNMEDGPPVILRLYGRGEVILRPSSDDEDGSSIDSEWRRLIKAHFSSDGQGGVLPGSRQIIINHVERVQTSCGYGVPSFEYRGDRETLKKYFAVKEKQDGAMETYWQQHNLTSIDGIDTPHGLLAAAATVAPPDTTSTSANAHESAHQDAGPSANNGTDESSHKQLARPSTNNSTDKSYNKRARPSADDGADKTSHKRADKE